MPRETRVGLKFKQDLEMGILLSFQQGYQGKCDRLKAAFGLGGPHCTPPPRPGSLLGISGVRISSGILRGREGSTVWFLWVGSGGSSGSGCGAEPAPRCIPPLTAAGLWFLGTSPRQDLAPSGQPPPTSAADFN